MSDALVDASELDESGLSIQLMEYQTCLADISQLDNDIWQSGSVIIGLSLAGIAILGQSSVQTILDLMTLLGTSAVGIGVLFIWRRLVHRWHFIIHVDFYRMSEIEECIGSLWMVRYVNFLSGTDDEKYQALAEIDKKRIQRIGRVITKDGGTSLSTTKYIDYLIWLIVGAWAFLGIKSMATFWLLH